MHIALNLSKSFIILRLPNKLQSKKKKYYTFKRKKGRKENKGKTERKKRDIVPTTK